jgi:tetratricopeptide (TPR) repeat protein
VDIFISYASEQRTLAEEIALALRAEGYQAFFDRAELADGDAYNAPLREAIRGCDLLVFLVSPEAVKEGRYTLTEIGFAEEKWPSPAGHVLPVMAEPTEAASIPPYLRAVVMLRPTGSIPAEVVAAVERLSKPRWLRLVRRVALPVGVLVLVGGGFVTWRAVEDWRACGQARHLVEEARLQQSAGDYAAAWDRYADGLAMCPGSDPALRGQERLAMDWLENIRVTQGKQTFTDIVTKVRPALSRAAVDKDDKRAADALAHLGWADFLRWRDGQGGLDPVRYYRQALQRDPENPYAHAFWGHNILTEDGNLQEAKAHFAKALASHADTPFVRELQLAALTWRTSPERQDEVARVTNEMRLQGEALHSVSSVWDVYYERLVRGHDRDDFLAALSPQDHLSTLEWLFPKYAQSSNRYAYLYMLAQLQEHAGDRAQALVSYQAVLATGVDSATIVGPARKAVRRLQGN